MSSWTIPLSVEPRRSATSSSVLVASCDAADSLSMAAVAFSITSSCSCSPFSSARLFARSIRSVLISCELSSWISRGFLLLSTSRNTGMQKANCSKANALHVYSSSVAPRHISLRGLHQFIPPTQISICDTKNYLLFNSKVMIFERYFSNTLYFSR